MDFPHRNHSFNVATHLRKTLSKLENLINRITEFGTKPDVVSENKTDEIRQLLVGIYSEYLNLKTDFDDSDFEEEPDFNYAEIKKNVESNFPEFGWYHSVWESHKLDKDADITTGDAIDDLSDIIKDMLEIKWQFENTSQKYAEWCFKDIMRIHSEQHLVNFLKYLKDKNG
jgi:hypothetical protein